MDPVTLGNTDEESVYGKALFTRGEKARERLKCPLSRWPTRLADGFGSKESPYLLSQDSPQMPADVGGGSPALGATQD